MKVGVTGHQRRPGIDWTWVKGQIISELSRLPPPIEGYSSLAEGADQVFAEAVLESGGNLTAIIPKPHYEEQFAPAARRQYLSLLQRAHAEELDPQHTDEESFFNAGKYIADHTSLLLAIWDGKRSAGPGGTADVVQYALARGANVVHIDPLKKTVRRLLSHSES
ncbi:MAG: hypothetical protein WCE79_17090 [Xanthobacteraceae bacterium]